MQIVDQGISKKELLQMAEQGFGDFVKAVVDIQKKIMAIDAELHADLEAALLQQGSKQENLWGINLYPALTGEDFLEFDSMINLRPAQGNQTRSVEDPKIRAQIKLLIHELCP